MGGATSLGLRLNSVQQDRFVRYCLLLQQANAGMNLTALREPEQMMTGLFLDSLSLSLAIPEMRDAGASEGLMLVDVGTGAGIPGVPLKILRPGMRLVLIDSVAKKTRFLRNLAGELELANLDVVTGRAEERASAGGHYRDSADVCTARAVAALPTLIELCAPFIKPGGRLVLPKSAPLEEEIAQAGAAAVALHVKLLDVVVVPPELGLGVRKRIVVYEKLTNTPPGYPRRVGLASSRPIRG
ncbi:MAG TPA: 16S rRNA (guanine(527)-N(7))-methyltransferase RsmG [Chloroflexota bacterium]|nr:16S rRNA (guanine(527)-N(7))-methyltransferase RsmG [Chloroflexota bacterium]